MTEEKDRIKEGREERQEEIDQSDLKRDKKYPKAKGDTTQEVPKGT